MGIEKLETSIELLRSSLARSTVEARFVKTASIEIETVGQILPLTDMLKQWYLIGAPNELCIPWLLEEMCLWSPQELVQGQVGYRWTGEVGGVLCKSWDPQWLVIGSNSADPIIADTSYSETPVLMAFHGTGTWNPKKIADSIPGFLYILAIWVELCKQNDDQIFDDEGEVKSSLLNDYRLLLEPILSDECLNNFTSFWV
ncbi:MAG: hypothetical protein R3C11_10745 [Planctomycetaceae bacterium]